MGSFICRQPNGLICRFSSVVDCPTHVNLTEEGYIDYCKEKGKDDAEWWIERDKNPSTHEYLTDKSEEYIKKLIECEINKAVAEGHDVLLNYMRPFDWVDDRFHPYNMSRALYKKYREMMETPINENTQYNICTETDGGDEDEDEDDTSILDTSYQEMTIEF